MRGKEGDHSGSDTGIFVMPKAKRRAHHPSHSTSRWSRPTGKSRRLRVGFPASSFEVEVVLAMIGRAARIRRLHVARAKE